VHFEQESFATLRRVLSTLEGGVVIRRLSVDRGRSPSFERGHSPPVNTPSRLSTRVISPAQNPMPVVRIFQLMQKIDRIFSIYGRNFFSLWIEAVPNPLMLRDADSRVMGIPTVVVVIPIS
jgi:hypothetical protein